MVPSETARCRALAIVLMPIALILHIVNCIESTVALAQINHQVT